MNLELFAEDQGPEEILDAEVARLQDLPNHVWRGILKVPMIKTVVGRDTKRYRIRVLASRAHSDAGNLRVTVSLTGTGWRRRPKLNSVFLVTYRSSMETLKEKIRTVPNFPKEGILFYDITTLLRDPEGFHAAVDTLVKPFVDTPLDLVVGVESRGFILGGAVADRLGVGFAPVRKPGKLPSETVRASYELEYGSDSLEMHWDAVQPGQRVLIVDDLLATGGTAQATVELVKHLGGLVHAVAFLVELTDLNGRSRLPGENVYSVLQYGGA